MPPPNLFYPRTSGPHRIACIALYRSLIAHSVRITLPASLTNSEDGQSVFGKIHPVKHFIRKKFRQNTQHSSPRLIVPALKAGYAAEEMLYAASTGDTAALTQIHDMLLKLYEQKLAARQACTQPPPKPIAAMRASLRPYPNAPRVIDVRPLPLEKLSSGRRHVPSLAVATYLPFIRFKKKQSPYLSRVLRQKVEQKQSRVLRIMELSAEVEDGILEGEWEDNVLWAAEREGRFEESKKLEEEGWGQEGVEGWESEALLTRNTVLSDIGKEFDRAGHLSYALREVVRKEKKLWEQERRERREAKRVAKGYVRGDMERKIKGNGKNEENLED